MVQAQVRSVRRSATAVRAGHVCGAAARQCAAELTGELAAAGTSVSRARRCIRCNESGWCQVRRVTWPMMRRPSASRAAAVRAGRRTARMTWDFMGGVDLMQR